MMILPLVVRALIGLIVVVFAAALIVLAAYIAVPTPAYPADAEHLRMYHHDQRYDAWFRSLLVPGSIYSCCSLRDCERTEAEWRRDNDGWRWYALVKGQMVPVPESAIVTSQPSIDGEAYVCTRTVLDRVTGSFIRCFVPPIPRLLMLPPAISRALGTLAAMYPEGMLCFAANSGRRLSEPQFVRWKGGWRTNIAGEWHLFDAQGRFVSRGEANRRWEKVRGAS